MGTEGRKMLAVSPGRRDRTKRPITWAKNSGVDALVAYTPTASRGHVDALGDHAHRDQPAAGACRELTDPIRRAVVIGQHDRRRLAGELGQQVGVSTGGGLVGGDDHAACIGHVLTLLLQPFVGRRDHRGHPFTGRVQRGAPGPCGLLGVQRLAEPRGSVLRPRCRATVTHPSRRGTPRAGPRRRPMRRCSRRCGRPASASGRRRRARS